MKQHGSRPLRSMTGVASASAGPAAPAGRLFEPLFEALADAIVMLDEGGTVVAANAAACTLAGVPNGRIVGTRAADFLQPGTDCGPALAALRRDGRVRAIATLRLGDGPSREIEIEVHAQVCPGAHVLVLREAAARSRLGEMLRRSEHRFQAVFDGVADAILVLATDGTIRDANAAAAAILGASQAELPGKPMAGFLAQPEALLRARADLPAHGRTLGRTTIRRDDGPVAVDFALSASGDPNRSLLILSAESPPPPGATPGDPLFRRAFEGSPSPAIVCERDSGRIVAVNQAAVAEYGYPREEFLGMTLDALRPPKLQLDKPIDQGGLWRHRRQDGTVAEVQVVCAPLVTEDGRTVLLLSHDPAHHISLSAELFEVSSQAIMITDAQVRIVAVNPAFTRITGYRAEEVLGRSPDVLASGRHDAAFYERMWNDIRNAGQWQGEIWNRRRSGEVFAEWLTISTVRNSLGETVQYIGMFSDISERKAAEARIEYLAHYDSLTGLPNRSLLQERFALAIAQAQRSRRRVGVLFLDLDRFKLVNDTLGHSAGDEVLRQTAHRLRGCLRQSDFVARQGGDEFIVLISDVDMIHDAAHVAQKIIEAMRHAMMVQGHELHMSPSIGISIYPDDGRDMESLLKNADIAMYQAKNAGRNNYQFFAQEMNETAFEHLAFEASLRRALENGQFLLHYQPQVEAASGRVVGVEALIRWNHPELGMVGPAQFIPVAEESGLIVPISIWVLRTACAQAIDWRKSGGCPVRMSVNISPLQFRHRDFVELVTEAVSREGMGPGSLELELTESVVMQDADATVAKLTALRRKGVGLAIDDFGTGYSSLSYLKRFPLDRLKIDQSFVRDIGRSSDSEAIIQAIVSMAHSLRLQTLAEGVETREQWKFLHSLGCDQIQGYLFSRPVPPAEIPPLIGRGPQPL